MFWQSYAYQYLVGGLLFFLGIGLVIYRGDANLSRREDRRTVVMLVCGITIYAVVQGFFQFYLATRGS